MLIFSYLSVDVPFLPGGITMSCGHKLLLLFLLLAAAGCDQAIISDCETVTPEPEPKPPEVHMITFTELQTLIFSPSCALTGCHSQASPQAGLVLEANKAFANLVDVSSTQSPGLKRIKPFDSANSYLLKKLNGTGTTRMPPSGKLPQAAIDSVKVWIDRGALNNLPGGTS
jgi:hypothetical protein